MLLKEIQNRKSVRQFSDKKIPKETISEIVEAGRLAPSWMNVQPWKFIIVESEEQKRLLSQCANFQKQITAASHVILILGDFSAWNNKNFSKILSQKGMAQDSITHILNDSGYNPAKNSNAILIARTMEQCSYAISFMNIQAESLGIDSCIIGAFANELTGFNPEISRNVRAEFEIPEDMFIAGMLALGYRSTDLPTKKIRKSTEDVVFYGKYGRVEIN